MDRITRKELKTDKFALEVEHTVEYFAEHRKQAIRYGAIALVLIILVAGFSYYRRHQRTARQEALNAALEVQRAAVGEAPSEFAKSFPNQAEKDKAATKAFGDIISKYPGSDEAAIARYYLGTIAADQGKLADAEKAFKEVAESGNEKYASLAKLALADIYRGQGKIAEGEKLLRSLIQKPTEFVSKEHATIVLAQLLGDSRPEEARKLLEPLRTERSVISRQALTLLSQLPAKK